MLPRATEKAVAGRMRPVAR